MWNNAFGLRGGAWARVLQPHDRQYKLCGGSAASFTVRPSFTAGCIVCSCEAYPNGRVYLVRG